MLNEESFNYKVFVVEDHPIVRDGLCYLISQEKNLTYFGYAESVSEAMEKLTDNLPDIVIIDISLKESNGLELIKDIKIRYPKLPILVISMYNESIYAERVLYSGANGYIMKSEMSEKIIAGIYIVLKGGYFFNEKIQSNIFKTFVTNNKLKNESPIEKLSDRELQVFQLIGEGLDTNDIAKNLKISPKTVEVYRRNIKAKLNIKKLNELIIYASNWILGNKNI
jgi:DNA-binding NarL/FixJ family response regulator